MTTSIENGPVVPHAQAFADEANRRWGTIFKTYNGHSPDRTQALDSWDVGADLDAVAQFARDNYIAYGIDYVIWRQRIWNPEILDGWRSMADRGSPTDNHMNHVHVSFETSAPGPFPATDPATMPAVEVPGPMPTLAMGDTGAAVVFLQERLIAHGHDLSKHGGADGDFGPWTRARVQIHQAAWKLDPDGVVGPITWPTLLVNLP